jgi:hypothetical protein
MNILETILSLEGRKRSDQVIHTNQLDIKIQKAVLECLDDHGTLKTDAGPLDMLQEIVKRLPDDILHKFWQPIQAEHHRRDLERADKMPPPSQEMLDVENKVEAIRLYRELHGCTLRIALFVISKHRNK